MTSAKELAKSLLKIGLFGFGGGIGMLALLRDECVKKKKYITDDELCTAVAMGQMLPGPFIPNYCEYIGYHLFGINGAVLAVCALLFPSFCLMIVLTWLYFMYQSLPGVLHIFRGVGTVVTAIILWASYDMGKVLIKDRKGFIVFICGLILFTIGIDPVITVLSCGLLKIGLDNAKATSRFLFAIPVFAFNFRKATELSIIFLKIGAVIFGGGYGAIPFIKNEVCTVRPWLTSKEFIDGVALGQMTPGPIAITATFVGFKVMGLPGAFIATLSIFLPSFIMLIVLIRIYKYISHNKYVISFFTGIKSAVVAVLLYTGIQFALLNWTSIPYGIFGAVLLLILFFKRVEPVLLIAMGAVFGLLLG